MRKIFSTLVLMLGIFISAFAQNRTIVGKVTDANGNPLSNASIMVKGTTSGVSTNDAGEYSITVNSGAKTLIISSVGFVAQELNIGNRGVINASLTSTASSMEEVVVVGYIAVKKKDVTAAVSTIGAGAIKNVPVQSFDQALVGKASGVNVLIPNGQLNNPPVIRVRGINSINGNTTPLIVVDGVPTFSGDNSTNLAPNNVLANINPSDIEDVQILKDAAAAAIYGSRAANGVMLITTKKGKAGKARVTYDAWAGWTSAFRLFNVLGAKDYIAIKNEAIKNANYQIPSSGLVTGSGLTPPPAGSPLYFMDTLNGVPVDTRWADYLYQTGFQHSHNLSVSGANQGTRYYFSANFTDQEGMIRTNTFERKQLRMNIEQKVNNAIKIGGNINFSRGTSYSPNSGSLPGTPFSTAGLARLAFVTAPNVSPYTANGNYNIVGLNDATLRNNFNQIGRNRNYDRSGFYNPVMIRDLNIISSQSDQLLGDLNAEVKLLKNFTFRSKYGATFLTVEDKTFYNSLHGDGIQTSATTDDGTAFNAVGKINSSTFQNTLTFDKTFKSAHSVNFMVGSESQYNTVDRWSAKRSGLSENFYNEFQGGYSINDNPNANTLTENYQISYFSSLYYNYKSRYFVSANVRRDGYSAYAEGKKWGDFWGASIGWSISDEKFWKGALSKAVNALKLRASYGTVGSIAAVGNFGALSTFSSGLYGTYPTLFFSQAGNNNLTWESSEKTDVGFQFGLLNDRITGEFAWWKTNNTDLIINVPTPPSYGIPGNTIQANAASMYTKGIEFSFDAKVIRKNDFTWSINGNITTQKNEVTALAPGVPEIIGTSQLERTNITRVGNAIGALYGVQTAGVDPATGRRIFLDASGRKVFFDFSAPSASRYRYEDGTVAPAIDLAKDGKILGSPVPKAYGGFGTNVNFKGFDLSTNFSFSLGHMVYFGSRAGMLDQRFWNNSVEVLNRWTTAGQVTNIPRVIYNDNISNGSAFPISDNFFKANYLRCNTLALGYTIDKGAAEMLKITSVRFYVQVSNPFLITKYPGADPEISVNGNSSITGGVDRNSIGQARTTSVGVNLVF